MGGHRFYCKANPNPPTVKLNGRPALRAGKKARSAEMAAHDYRVRELARRLIVLGESVAKASAKIGWGSQKAVEVMRTDPLYQKARQSVIERLERRHEKAIDEMGAILDANALMAAFRHNMILTSSENEVVVAKVGTDALDRVGARAAAKQDVAVTHQLSPETVRMLKEAMEGRPPIRMVKESPFSYALEAPKPKVGKDDDDGEEL
jgi:hypothetical protein